jgi:threonine dehydratase
MPYSTKTDLPTFADVQSAAERIRGNAVVTPLLESALLNDKLGGRLLVKAETLQRGGAFKFRGAYNCMSRLDEAQRKGGVVTFSSGNHAQAVAFVARMLGISAVIVMPQDAPTAKVANTRAYGAEVVFYDRLKDDREAIGRRITEERNATLIPPYEHPHVMAGQGTVGLEITSQAKDMGAKLDAVMVPCSGGGLVAGCAIAVSETSPGTKIYCVEPEEFDDTSRSLESGKRESNPPEAKSFCDALLVPTPGEMTFAVNSRLLAGGLRVSDDAVSQAMATAFEYFKLVVEPGGAVALAAALAAGKGKTIAVVCSGGNVDAEPFRDALKRLS